MNTENDISGIADASQPNAGRMYDFFLGGSHNFEIDRQAAQQVLQYAPFLPQFLRLVRWFLGEAARRLSDQGYDKFLDFASGLPTVDHIHQILPSETRVIYSDIDPVTVAYAQEIIGDNPNVRYVHCDAGKPEDLLNSGIIEEVFGKDRKVTIGFNGIAWFLPHEKAGGSLKKLYEWADTGSKLFICDADMSEFTEAAKKSAEIYAKVGQPFYPRSLDKMRELISPWEIDEPGVQPLHQWLDMMEEGREVALQIRDGWGVDLYGIILKK